MERIVAQIVEIVKRKYGKELIDKEDLRKVEKVFKKVSDELTANSLKKYLEDYDQELKLGDKRDSKYVIQRMVSKNITSVLGTFSLNRTRYYDKENNCYFCLLDRKLNIPEYEHMTPLAMARMLEVATNSSYSIAGKEINSQDAFTKIAETYFYQRTHYCEDSEIIKYTYRAREHHNLNKSYINRLQATIPDYYMNKKILENRDINY